MVDLGLTTSEGFVGPAAGVSVAEPSNKTVSIKNDTASDFDDLVSYCATGNYRIQVSPGLEFQQDETLVIAGGTQLYCPNGSFKINGRNFLGSGSTHVVLNNLTITGDIILSNFIIMNSYGYEVVGNNVTAALDFGDFSGNFYGFALGFDLDPLIGNLGGNGFDEPETIEVFNNTNDPDYTRNITFDRCYVPAYVSGSKFFQSSGGGSNTTTNTLVCFYRGYSYAHKRNPRGNDGLSIDLCNWVQPTIGASIQAGPDTRSSVGNSKVDFRGVWVQDNNASNGDIFLQDGALAVYYVIDSSGDAANDANVENGNPLIVFPPGEPQSTSQITLYTSRGLTKPSANAMNSTLRNQILAEVAGTYDITPGPSTPVLGTPPIFSSVS